MSKTRLGRSSLAIALSCSGAVADTYPSKPIRLIVPLTPESGSDMPARVIRSEIETRAKVLRAPGAK